MPVTQCSRQCNSVTYRRFLLSCNGKSPDDEIWKVFGFFEGDWYFAIRFCTRCWPIMFTLLLQTEQWTMNHFLSFKRKLHHNHVIHIICKSIQLAVILNKKFTLISTTIFNTTYFIYILWYPIPFFLLASLSAWRFSHTFVARPLSKSLRYWLWLGLGYLENIQVQLNR